jgi:hypothetical protein
MKPMCEHSRHWLDYDPIAQLVLLFGFGAGALVTLSIRRFDHRRILGSGITDRASGGGPTWVGLTA